MSLMLPKRREDAKQVGFQCVDVEASFARRLMCGDGVGELNHQWVRRTSISREADSAIGTRQREDLRTAVEHHAPARAAIRREIEIAATILPFCHPSDANGHVC